MRGKMRLAEGVTEELVQLILPGFEKVMERGDDVLVNRTRVRVVRRSHPHYNLRTGGTGEVGVAIP